LYDPVGITLIKCNGHVRGLAAAWKNQVERNPLRANLVAKAEDWRWSSRRILGRSEEPEEIGFVEHLGIPEAVQENTRYRAIKAECRLSQPG